MNLINIYCITSENHNYLNSLPIKKIISGSISKDVSLFPDQWIRDNNGVNISYKNLNFGTLTSHYWLWKNQLDKHHDNEWIGFCHYRRFWIKNNIKTEINIKNLKDNILKELPHFEDGTNAILPDKIILKNLKLSKLLKKGFKNYIRNPKLLFSHKLININLHFDLFHGYDLLNRSARHLNSEDQKDFINYINSKKSFYPLQIFITKPDILKKLYHKTFKWIFCCEKEFTDLKLEGYGKTRLYDFLAERYFSFFFEKYTKIKTWPYILLNKF